MKLRFRRYGSSDWTLISIDGELDAAAMSVLGSGLRHYHVQVWEAEKWEDLW